MPWWLFPAVIGAFLTAVYVLRVTKQIFWGPKAADAPLQHLPDAHGAGVGGPRLLVGPRPLRGRAGHRIGPVDTATCRCSSA